MGMVKQAAEARAMQLAKADGVSVDDFYCNEVIFTKYWEKAVKELQGEWNRQADDDDNDE